MMIWLSGEPVSLIISKKKFYACANNEDNNANKCFSRFSNAVIKFFH
ncbi:hypothetical protein CbuG_0862 [Coxiella burnetii CbuG_Q212]|nr:hypothetical protein CbuG_0862 [Coxiella burnetii CbuG_Q212]